MASIEGKVVSFIYENKLLEEVDKVYVATSGGADSMALLAFMNKHKAFFGIEIGAVHVNHGIRGETARRDANFVSEYCKKEKIEFILFDAEADKVEVPEEASEEWARRLRYNYFNRLNRKGTKIATAHTLSDQTETVIFRMARGGSGLNGLSGIPVKRDSFIRPFLCITRSEVEQLVEKYGTGNITDETNLGDDYSRNKIRHHVIPILKRINPNAELSVGKVCARIEKAQEYIEKVAAEKLYNADKNHGNPEAPHWVEYKTPNFLAEDEIIQEEMICQLLGKINFLNEQFIELLKNYINTPFHDDGAEFFFGELQLSDKQSIVVTSKYITIKNREEEKVTGLEEGKVTFGQFKYSFDIKQINQEQFQSECKSKEHLKWYADASKLDVSKCILRSKSEGDKFKPACKTGGKVSKFLKWAPIAEKDSIPLIEYEGKIVWVYGEGFTDGFTPDQDTDKVYSIY